MAAPKVYYNSACPVCRAGVADQKRRMDKHGVAAEWCDIAATPAAAKEIDAGLDTVRHSLHVVDEHGRLAVGADAFAALWRATPGRRWLARLISAPVVRPIARWLYDRFADRLFAWNRRNGRW